MVPCTIAASDKEKANQAEKQLQAAKGKPEEYALAPAYEAAKRAAYVSQANCDQMKTQQRVFIAAGCIAGVFGFFLVLGGIGAFIFGIRRARSA